LALFDGTNWSADTPFTNLFITYDPKPVPWAGGITVLHTGLENGRLWYTFSPNGQDWGGDTPVPAVTLENSPAPVVYNGNLNVFHQDYKGDFLRLAEFNGRNWSADIPFPSIIATDSPSAVVYNGNLYVFYQGANGSGQLWYMVLSDTGWSGPILVPVLALSRSPAPVVYNGLLYVFHQGGPGGLGDGDGQLHYAVFNGTNWSADIPLDIGMSFTPSAVAWARGISVFHHGPNHDGTLSYVFSPDGQHWGGDTLVPVLALGRSPGCVVY
jgi:hypothetical protein